MDCPPLSQRYVCLITLHSVKLWTGYNAHRQGKADIDGSGCHLSFANCCVRELSWGRAGHAWCGPWERRRRVGVWCVEVGMCV